MITVRHTAEGVRAKSFACIDHVSYGKAMYAMGLRPANYPVPAIQYRVTWDIDGTPTVWRKGYKFVGRYRFDWLERVLVWL